MADEYTLTHIKTSSLKGKVSDAEWHARVELAACYRLVDLYGMSDMIANHISVRVPGEENVFLLNPYGYLYDEITASSLIKINQHGEILHRPDFSPEAYGINRAGFVIHSAIHQARPEVECVIHTHTWAGMALSSLKEGLIPLTQTAMRFLHIGYHDYQGVVLDVAEQASLVAHLGSHNALILRNHGLLTVGNTIAEAFNAMQRLELSARTQLAALACKSELSEVLQQVLDDTYMNYQPQTRGAFGLREWPALLRRLNRLDPSYRD